MPNHIHIETDFPVSDDQREHARHINGLETATAAYEAAIKEVTGKDVRLNVYVRKHTDENTKAERAAAKLAKITPGNPGGPSAEQPPEAPPAAPVVLPVVMDPPHGSRQRGAAQAAE